MYFDQAASSIPQRATHFIDPDFRLSTYNDLSEYIACSAALQNSIMPHAPQGSVIPKVNQSIATDNPIVYGHQTIQTYSEEQLGTQVSQIIEPIHAKSYMEKREKSMNSVKGLTK